MLVCGVFVCVPVTETEHTETRCNILQHTCNTEKRTGHHDSTSERQIYYHTVSQLEFSLDSSWSVLMSLPEKTKFDSFGIDFCYEPFKL